MSWHIDKEWRIHVPIHTSVGSFITFETDEDNGYYTTHLPADGSAYMADVRPNHTATNSSKSGYIYDGFGKDARINLLCNVVSVRGEGKQQMEDKQMHENFGVIE